MKDKQPNEAQREEQERDRLLRCLLKTPPQPRPKRERDKVRPRKGDGPHHGSAD